jgi:O-antigen ligase
MIYPVLIAATILAALGAILALFGAVKLGDRVRGGFLPIYFASSFFSVAVASAFSGRDLAATEDAIILAPMGFLSEWATRWTSLCAVIAFLVAIYRTGILGRHLSPRRWSIIFFSSLFWVTNFICPVFFAEHKTTMNIGLMYVPLVIVAITLSNRDELLESIKWLRNSIVAFVATSWVFCLFAPHLVLQTSYSQGYFGDIPRFAGLAPHAITFAVPVSLGLWLAIDHPYKNKHIQRLVIFGLLAALFMTQAKAVWTSVFIGMLIRWASRLRELEFSYNRLAVGKGRYAVATLSFFILMIGAGSLVFFFNRGEDIMTSILSGEEGQKLSSFTGRDQIWAVAYLEWLKQPIFGYGLALFGDLHRAQIGMSFATSGHNLWYDTLGRTGIIGTVGVTIFLIAILYMSLKSFKATRGFALIVLAGILSRSISEVTLSATALGLDTLPQFVVLLLLVCYEPVITENKQLRSQSFTPNVGHKF